MMAIGMLKLNGAGLYNNKGFHSDQHIEISDHQQSWGYEECPQKGPPSRSASDR
jgi:hypothetical protein